MAELTVSQGTNTTTSTYIKGVTATFYDPNRNWLRYGIVSSVTYLGDPTYKIAHKAFYVPRVIASATDRDNYINKRGIVSLNQYTTGTVNIRVDDYYAIQNVDPLPTLSGSKVVATDASSAYVESQYAVGQSVSALITSLNVIILGRVSAIRYINAGSDGSAASGYFRYYIKSWAQGPSGPILRTYSTNEQYVSLPNELISYFVDLGAVPVRPMLNVVIKPEFIQGGIPPKDYTLKENRVTFTASGGIAPYVWTISTGTMMTGTSIYTISSVNSVITGTATTTGTFQFRLQAADSDPEGSNIGTRTFLVTMEPWTGEGTGGGTSGGGWDISGK